MADAGSIVIGKSLAIESALLKERRPRIPSAVVETLARAYEKQGDTESATRYFRQALALSPGSRQVREKLQALGIEPETPSLSLSAAELQPYAATYRVENMFDIEVTFEAGALRYAASAGEPKRELVPMARDRFYFENSPLQLSFERDRSGKIVAITTYHRGMITSKGYRLG